MGYVVLPGWTATHPKLIKNTKNKTQAALQDIALGLQNYHIEYGRWPVPGDAEVKTTFAAELLRIMLGDNIYGLNVRGIAYIEPPQAKNGKGGLTGDKEHPALTDVWGHSYVIILDANGDHKIDNPDLKNTDPSVSHGAPAQIAADVVVYSLGPDGIEGTKDDVVSLLR